MSWPISVLSTVGRCLLLNCWFHDKYERTLQGNLVEHTWILWGQVDMAPTTTSRWHISPRFPRLGLNLYVIVVNMAVSTGMKNLMKTFHTCTKNEDHGYGCIVTPISQGELWAFILCVFNCVQYTLHSGVPGQVAHFQRVPTNISGSGQNIGRLWQKERELDADATKVVTVADSWSTSESWTFMELLISYDFTTECLDLFVCRTQRKFVLFFCN